MTPTNTPASLLVCSFLLCSCGVLTADIETNFATTEGFRVGQSGFTITDSDDSGFSVVHSSSGEIVFFREPSLYFESNRALGVRGDSTAVFEFNPPASEFAAWGQDTSGEFDNENGVVLGNAVGEIEVFDANGSLGVLPFPEGSFGPLEFESASGITSFQIRNLSVDTTSWSLLGGIRAVALPEPSGIYLAMTGLLPLFRRPRRIEGKSETLQRESANALRRSADSER